jgi:hypothetical protein
VALDGHSFITWESKIDGLLTRNEMELAAACRAKLAKDEVFGPVNYATCGVFRYPRR